jgi:hypothetical protein
VALLLCGTQGVAQDPVDIATGLNPQATYHGSDIDLIDMTTTRLRLHIPLLTDHSQRGDLNFNYSLNFSSTPSQWKTGPPPCQPPYPLCTWLPPGPSPFGPSFEIDGFLSGGGQTFNDKGSGTQRAYFSTEADGSKHTLGTLTTAYPPTLLEAIDGSGIRKILDGSGNYVFINRQGVRFNPINPISCTTTYTQSVELYRITGSWIIESWSQPD